MGASTTKNMVVDARDAEFQKVNLLDAKVGSEFLHAKDWNLVGSDFGVALAAVGGGDNFAWTMWAGGNTDDAVDYLWAVPCDLDRGQPIYFQVYFTNSATADETATWTITTNPLAPALDAATSDAFDVAPATALGTTIPACTAMVDSTTADVDLVTKSYVGAIAAGGIDDDEEFVGLRVTLASSADAADWGFLGLRILYSRLVS